MEDAHVFTFDLPHHTNSAFFGVFDGHAGSLPGFASSCCSLSLCFLGNLCSPFVAEHLPNYIDRVTDWNDEQVVVKACLECDEAFLTKYRTFVLRFPTAGFLIASCVLARNLPARRTALRPCLPWCSQLLTGRTSLRSSAATLAIPALFSAV